MFDYICFLTSRFTSIFIKFCFLDIEKPLTLDNFVFYKIFVYFFFDTRSSVFYVDNHFLINTTNTFLKEFVFGYAYFLEFESFIKGKLGIIYKIYSNNSRYGENYLYHLLNKHVLNPYYDFFYSFDFFNFVSIFGYKIIGSCLLLIAIRAGVPRFRIDYLTKLGWSKYVLFTVAACLIIYISLSII